jgi:hypothetical protein
MRVTSVAGLKKNESHLAFNGRDGLMNRVYIMTAMYIGDEEHGRE